MIQDFYGEHTFKFLLQVYIAGIYFRYIFQVYISETSTSHVANATNTAGSVTADLNGMAILDACVQIKERLHPYVLRNPNGMKTRLKRAFFHDIDAFAQII